MLPRIASKDHMIGVLCTVNGNPPYLWHIGVWRVQTVSKLSDCVNGALRSSNRAGVVN